MSLVIETERVHQHFDGARALLATAPSQRDRTTQLARALLAHELALYQDARVFPKNVDEPRFPRPTFIDAQGTRCAMAHLMELGGAGELVAEIATHRNHAFVAELVRDARVRAWLDAAGLTAAEAARIQPTYGVVPAAECLCLVSSVPGTDPGDGDVVAVLEATVTATTPDLQVRIDAAHGKVPGAAGTVVTLDGRVYPNVEMAAGDRVLAVRTFGGERRLLTTFDDAGNVGKKCFVPRAGANVMAERGQNGFLSIAEVESLLQVPRADCAQRLEAIDPCFVRNGTREPGYDGGDSTSFGAPFCSYAPRTPGVTASLADAGAAEPADAGAMNAATASSDGGCNAGGIASPVSTSLGVLLAVAGAMLARRRRH